MKPVDSVNMTVSLDDPSVVTEKLWYRRLSHDTELKSTAEFDKKKTHVLPDGNIIPDTRTASDARKCFSSRNFFTGRDVEIVV